MNILLSGGASGADNIFAMCAEARGDKVYAFSFPGHQVYGGGAYKLNPGQLETYVNLLDETSKTLGRKFDKVRPPNDGFRFRRNLLLRNAYQIFGLEETGKTETVYAIGKLIKERTQLEGGTGWAIEIAVKHAHDPAIFVFDQSTEKWYTWVDERFESCQTPPSPKGVYTGIGTRDLKDSGIKAIGELYGIPLDEPIEP